MADELLRALAQRQRDADASEPEFADAVEEDAGEALLDDLFAQLDAPAKPPTAEPEPVATVTELPRRRSAIWAAAGIALAAAAALVLWFASQAPTAKPLPTYNAVVIAGGPAAVRGQHDAVASTVTLKSPSGPIKFQLAPATPVDGTVVVALLARPKQGDAIFALASKATVVESGSVELRGPLSDFIELSPGTWTVDVIIARAEDAPESASEATQGDWPRHAIEVIIGSP